MSSAHEPAVLEYLHTNDGATERPRTVAAALGLPISTVVATLQSLQRQSLVVRVGRMGLHGRGNFTSLWRAL